MIMDYSLAAHGLPVGCPWTDRGLFMECAWVAYGIPLGRVCGLSMGFPWVLCRLSIGCPQAVRGFSMSLSRAAHDCPRAVRWLPMDNSRAVRGLSASCPRDAHEMSVRCPWDVRALPMGHARTVHGLTACCPWSAHRISGGCSRDMHELPRRCPWPIRGPIVGSCPWAIHELSVGCISYGMPMNIRQNVQQRRSSESSQLRPSRGSE